mmetsp:Transcript_37786/g.106768  ORF Transcript_37786/g.106768 Transcript_37786/m.106768 type:complete len:741 (-) Transcript_37786:199-2421(-)
MARVYSALEELGYSVAHRTVDARGWGVPTIAARVMVLASLDGDPRDVLLGERGTGLCSGNPDSSTTCRGQCEGALGQPCYTCYLKQISAASQVGKSGTSARQRVHGATIDLTGCWSTASATAGTPPGEEEHSEEEDCEGGADGGWTSQTWQPDVLFPLCSSNATVACVLQCTSAGNARTRLLSPGDLEHLRGLPQGWTEGCIQDPLAPPLDPAPSTSNKQLRWVRMALASDSSPAHFARWVGNNLARLYRQNKYICDAEFEAADAQAMSSCSHYWPKAGYSLASNEAGSSVRCVIRKAGEFPVLSAFQPLAQAVPINNGSEACLAAVQRWAGRQVASERGPCLPSWLWRAISKGMNPNKRQLDSTKPPMWAGEVGFIALNESAMAKEARKPRWLLWPVLLLDPGEGSSDGFLPQSGFGGVELPLPEEERAVLLLGMDEDLPSCRWTHTGLHKVLPFPSYRMVADLQPRAKDLHQQGDMAGGGGPSCPAGMRTALEEADEHFRLQSHCPPSEVPLTSDIADANAAPATPPGQEALGNSPPVPPCGHCTLCVALAVGHPEQAGAGEQRELQQEPADGHDADSSDAQTRHRHIVGSAAVPPPDLQDHSNVEEPAELLGSPTPSGAAPTDPTGPVANLCLLARARVVARQGHQGAALSVLGNSAIGAIVEVFWPLEEEWFRGTLRSFSPLTTQHAIKYDDGDEETTWLWTRAVRLIKQPASEDCASNQLPIKQQRRGKRQRRGK